MNSNFIISISPSKDYSAAVIAAGVKNPMDCISEVEKNLKQQKVQGKVFFDLLVAHGSKFNRYFVGQFDGNHFSSSRFQNVDEFYNELSTISAAILKNESDHVDGSLLSRAMLFAIKQGIPL